MSCPSFELGGDAASAALRSAAPAILRGFPAAASFGAALALGPTFGAAHMALGNSRAELARMPEACGHFARAVSLTPRDARPYTSLGRALRADGRAAEAEAVLEAARRLGRRASQLL